ncbi:MAG: YggS family pyridoxal phosphate-dependent enzyme [Bacteroidales bacterium]|nr:YggS family pyridoxal phosphate-dependent enzyme [Bacteroidales bacterium]
MSIKNNLNRIQSSLPEQVTLVAISKTKPDEDLLEAYQAGQIIFGENKVQELLGKYERLPKDIEWHFIGHLQSNKIKYIAKFVSLIHAVDSFKLLKAIDKEAEKNNRVINCLLQMHIAEEESKFGFSPEELEVLIHDESWTSLKHVKIVGLMGMATYTEDTQQIHSEFALLKSYFDRFKTGIFKSKDEFNILSMGMSGDYQIAIEEGSNMVRIGSSIFGERHYIK